MTRKSKIILSVASAVYALDRLTKILIVKYFGLGDTYTVFEGYFDITHVRNTGAAFGFLSFLDGTYRLPFFVVTTLAAVALLVYFVRRTGPGDTLVLTALALIIGGALGNLTDRLLYGNVIDFIDWHVGGYHWPAFNIADSGITTGIFLLGIEIIIKGKTSES